MAKMVSCLQGCFKTCFSFCPCLCQDPRVGKRRLSSSKDSSSDSDKERSYSQSQEAETTHSLKKDVVLSATRLNPNDGPVVCPGQSEARSELMSAKRGGTTTTLSSGDADKQPPTELYYADSVQEKTN